MRFFGYAIIKFHMKSGNVLKTKATHWSIKSKDNTISSYKLNGITNCFVLPDLNQVEFVTIHQPWWIQIIRSFLIRWKNDNKLD